LKQKGNRAITTEKEQVFILDGKYSIAKNELGFLIGRAEPTTAQDAKKLAPVGKNGVEIARFFFLNLCFSSYFP